MSEQTAAAAVLKQGAKLHGQIQALVASVQEMDQRVQAFQDASGRQPDGGHVPNIRVLVMNALTDLDERMGKARPNFGGRISNQEVRPENIGASALACYGYDPNAGGQ